MRIKCAQFNPDIIDGDMLARENVKFRTISGKVNIFAMTREDIDLNFEPKLQLCFETFETFSE